MMDKFKSRKFLVWVVWTLLAGLCFFIKTEPSVLNTVVQYYGIISVVYIGANAYTKPLIKGDLK